ncbi:MAG: hypothetical protein H8E36_16755 [Rhodospirillaceae bacterium]|nr:hypothetical protein [Rhodospirillaceae bacterium]MBL6930834.1 hypothetical protein [Rhodospirillales bacterium]MBL6942554.1 hypothetical protein [Rhodospirillales bacterium]
MDFSEPHVLVVDDETFVRKMIHRLPDMIGVTKNSEASDGSPPDIVILDIMMEPRKCPSRKFRKAALRHVM